MRHSDERCAKKQRCVKPNSLRGHQRRLGGGGVCEKSSLRVIWEEKKLLGRRESLKGKKKVERRRNPAWMRALCAHIAFIHPSGEIRINQKEENQSEEACESLSATTLKSLVEWAARPGSAFKCEYCCVFSIQILLFFCITCTMMTIVTKWAIIGQLQWAVSGAERCL